MTRSPQHWYVRFATLVALVALLLTPSRALAQPSSAEAESHFKRGVSLYQEADFKAALVEFKRAYELSHNWRLLYNVAQAEYQSHDYAAALVSFETYLRDGGDKLPRGRRAEVDQEMARLRARVGRLTIRANVAGAIVVIDDEAAGSAPVTKNVAVGQRRIALKKDGYVTWSRAVDVAGGDDRIIEATLEPATDGAPPPPPPPPPPPATRRVPWEAWAVTGVLTAAAVTTGILALGAASDLDHAKGRFDVTDTELHDASKKVKTLGLVTDILAVAAIASGAVSLYLTVRPQGGGLTAAGRF